VEGAAGTTAEDATAGGATGASQPSNLITIGRGRGFIDARKVLWVPA
jgi:hypothetical protein